MNTKPYYQAKCRRCGKDSTIEIINSTGRTLLYSCDDCYVYSNQCYIPYHDNQCYIPYQDKQSEKSQEPLESNNQPAKFIISIDYNYKTTITNK